jgi:iron complex outermembrane receptor protein
LGKEFQRSLHVTSVLGLDWKPGNAWQISAQTRYHSGYFSDDLNRPDLRIGNATGLDLRVSYETRPATVFAYARNALNSFSLAYLFTPTFGTPTDPRELGLGLEARF